MSNIDWQKKMTATDVWKFGRPIIGFVSGVLFVIAFIYLVFMQLDSGDSKGGFILLPFMAIIGFWLVIAMVACAIGFRKKNIFFSWFSLGATLALLFNPVAFVVYEFIAYVLGAF